MADTPEVSIVLPTYNRSRTLGRAIDSVLAQGFEDFELIVVDDGSTDATVDFDPGIDPRIVLIRRENGGVGAARNTGLDAARGRFITFLDSDDEWLPNALGLQVGFLQAHPEAQWVNADAITDLDDRPMMLNDVFGEHLPNAQRIGSDTFDLPAGETDDFLRVFDEREPMGAWAAPWLPDDEWRELFVYRGDLFRRMKYGYFTWLPTLTMTRHALETVGRFDESLLSAGDYPFMAAIARNFPAHFLPVVVAIKHDLGLDGEPLNDHLATGATTYRFHTNLIRSIDALYGDAADDPELRAIRRRLEYETGVVALELGKRDEAIRHFGNTAGFDRHFWRGHVLRALCVVAGSGERAASIYQGSMRGLRSLRNLVRRG